MELAFRLLLLLLSLLEAAGEGGYLGGHRGKGEKGLGKFC